MPEDAEQTPVPRTARRGRALVCDDEIEIARLMAPILAMEGLEVEPTDDPCSIEARLAAREFDLLILDHLMPGRLGLDALAALRGGQEPGRSIPVIILTAKRLSPEERARARTLGATVMEKPFRLDELVHRVRRCLSTR